MATGVPDFAIMVPSPRAAASTSSENLAFGLGDIELFHRTPAHIFGVLTKFGQYPWHE
jgi:hypothetical protein